MCPEEMAEAVTDVEWMAGRLAAILDSFARPYSWPTPPDADPLKARPFGYLPEKGAAVVGFAFSDALPTLALGLRLQADPTIRAWVKELQALEGPERQVRARELAAGAPRGVAGRVIAQMLLDAADGGLRRLVMAGAFSAAVGTTRNPHDPQRVPKQGAVHNRVVGLAKTADRIVRALVAYPRGIEPAANSDAASRACQRLLQEVGARILRDSELGAPASLSRTRRARRTTQRAA